MQSVVHNQVRQTSPPVATLQEQSVSPTLAIPGAMARGGSAIVHTLRVWEMNPQPDAYNA